MRQEKQLLLDEIRGKMEASSSMILTRYGKWSAVKSHQFRRGVRAKGAEFEVVRKRILLKAAHAAGVTLPEAWLDGHIGVIFISGDPLIAAKEIDRFSQENESVLQMVGGRIDGELINGTDVTILARLPSLNELRAQLIGLLQAPMANLLAVMEAKVESEAPAAVQADAGAPVAEEPKAAHADTVDSSSVAEGVEPSGTDSEK